MTSSAKVCPSCGRAFAPKLAVNGKIRNRLIEVLGEHPEGLTIERLVHLVYADRPDGGPLTASASLNVIMHRANKDLQSQGYQIVPSWRGPGATYRLVKTPVKGIFTLPRYKADSPYSWGRNQPMLIQSRGRNQEAARRRPLNAEQAR